VGQLFLRGRSDARPLSWLGQTNSGQGAPIENVRLEPLTYMYRLKRERIRFYLIFVVGFLSHASCVIASSDGTSIIPTEFQVNMA
jgi:hypothetical protein